MGRSDTSGTHTGTTGRVEPGEEFPTEPPPDGSPDQSWTPESIHQRSVAASREHADSRWQWPYLSQTLTMAQNGRETGAFIAGHLFGRQMHNEPGLRVAVLPDHLAGTVAFLIAAGVAVAPHSTQDFDGRIVIDVWCESYEPGVHIDASSPNELRVTHLT